MIGQLRTEDQFDIVLTITIAQVTEIIMVFNTIENLILKNVKKNL